MIPVLTVSQMQAIDEKAIDGDLTIGYSYMQKAGMGLFAAAREMLPDHRAGEVAVLCGKGNNGGDGYVVARLLLEAGYKVMCFSLCDGGDLAGEARLAFNEFIGRKGNFLALDDAGDLAILSRCRLIVDALLGTGTRGDPHGLCAQAIAAINDSRVPVLSVDTPSGLNNDSGVPGEPCVKATVTVTMGFPKIGLYFYPGRAQVGTLIVQDLGYPDEIVDGIQPALFVPTFGKLQELLPPRKPSGSKFDHGLALLLCGSKGMTGSATLVAKAALRTGCGMTHCASPESIIPILSGKLTETVLHPLPETSEGTASSASLQQLLELAGSMQALCIGPGISHNDDTSGLVRKLVSSCNLPIVLDADGINAYKGRTDELAAHVGNLIITPHRGEWRRLYGDLPVLPTAMIERLREKAAEANMTVLLKGNPTVCADPAGAAYILPFGTSALAKAGSGDVLSGIIVSLAAQGASCTHAAILGAYIHGEAGVRASITRGEYSVIPTDLIATISKVMMRLCAR